MPWEIPRLCRSGGRSLTEPTVGFSRETPATPLTLSPLSLFPLPGEREEGEGYWGEGSLRRAQLAANGWAQAPLRGSRSTKPPALPGDAYLTGSAALSRSMFSLAYEQQ